MNDTNNKSSALFTPSGCLTGDGLMQFVSGSLQDSDLLLAQQHIAECPLCTDAADGLRLWLGVNKRNASSSTDFAMPQLRGSSGNSEPKKTYSEKSPVSSKIDFNKRTSAINTRIKQRLHAHTLKETSEQRHLSYKPFVWMAAAASIVLFIGGFYVIWKQNQFDAERLASLRANELNLIESTSGTDTLDISLPDSKEIIALNNKSENENQRTNYSDEVSINYNLEIADFDNPADEVSESAAMPENQAKEISVLTEETQVYQDDQVKNRPAAKSTGAVMKKSEVEEESSEVFIVVEQMPEFPGGDKERVKFLAENIVYPTQASENGIQGTVYVSFVIKKDGSISDCRIIKGIGGGCDEEALRVVKLMPLWKAGKQRGKNVDVQFTMPVSFKLNN